MKVSYLGIIFLAIILRFWALGSIPAGFQADEVAYGYNAYSILKTGRDEYGKLFPLVLKSYGDYKVAVYSYLTVPFIAAFGLSEFSVRVPSTVFGLLFIILTYALVFRLSKSYQLALLSMMLAAISPLGIFLSRVQSDPLICVTFFYAAFYFWLEFVKKRAWWYLILIVLSIFLSFYTYIETRIFSIPFLLLVGIFNWATLDKRVKRVAFGIVVFVALFVGGLLLSSANTRFGQLNIFAKPNVQLVLDEELREDGAMGKNIIVSRIVHNKPMAYTRYFLKNYADYLSFDFLFSQAEQPLREQVPHMGVLLLIELPFLLAGIYSAIRKRLKYGIFGIAWALLVPATLGIASDETPNIHRFFLAMLPIHMLTAMGIVQVYKKIASQYRKIASFCIVFLFAANVGYFLHQLFVHQPIHNPMYRNDEYTRLTREIKALYASYDVIVTPQILGHILFYWPMDPATYQKLGSPRDTEYGRLDKFFFVSDGCPSNLQNPNIRELSTSRVLYVDKAECKIDSKDKVVQTIRYQNSLEAYHLVEKK